MLVSLQSVGEWNGALVAAWVQAIGSVAAIIAAIIIPRLGTKSGLKQATIASREIASLIRCRVDDLLEHADKGVQYAPKQASALDLGSLESTLVRFPIGSLPAAALPAFMSLIGLCQEGQHIWFSDELPAAKIAALQATRARVVAIEALLSSIGRGRSVQPWLQPPAGRRQAATSDGKMQKAKV